ncbi:Uncharacterised protein [Bordetella pertussis]|nr:Uncharacterised protein [Bordetella pertussis]
MTAEKGNTLATTGARDIASGTPAARRLRLCHPAWPQAAG